MALQGYVDVDKYTLQHRSYKNVFALGDCRYGVVVVVVVVVVEVVVVVVVVVEEEEEEIEEVVLLVAVSFISPLLFLHTAPFPPVRPWQPSQLRPPYWSII